MHASPTPLAILVARAPVLTALVADFKRNTWTFSLPALPVGPGEYVVLRAAEAQEALRDEPPAQVVLKQPGKVLARFDDACRIGRGYGSYALDIEGDGFDCTLWREHCPDLGEEDRFDPYVWHGFEERAGSDGSMWRRSVRLVCDDFGTLVPRQERAQ